MLLVRFQPFGGKIRASDARDVRLALWTRAAAMSDADAEATARVMKRVSLVVLVAQNSLLAVTMKYSRLNASDGGELYIASTAVVICEVLKMAISVALLTREYMDELAAAPDDDDEGGAGAGGGSAPAAAADSGQAVSYRLPGWWTAMAAVLRTRVFVRRADFVRLAVPAALYTVQNNLQYFAVSNLEAATFQLLSQLKILTTALFSVLLLGKTLKAAQWGALLLLTLGVALVQLSAMNPAAGDAGASAGGSSSFYGLLAVLCACCSSGLAGVYFEKVLKSHKVSLWVRNTQLACVGVAFGLAGVVSRDGAAVARRGFFAGYTPIVWAVVTLQVLGGLVVALVVKYADNILKGFATSLAIVLTCVISVFLFNFSLTARFAVGAALVLYSTYMYSNPPGPK